MGPESISQGTFHRIMDKPATSKPFRLLGVDFAPLSLPLERRLQTIGALTLSSIILIGFPLGFIIFFYLLKHYQWIGLTYLTWFIYDFMTPFRGGRNLHGFVCQNVRNWRVWKYMRDYFPVQTIKTVDLDPSKEYLVGSHPHGVMTSGAFATFASNDVDFEKLYPSMKSRIIGASSLFFIPFIRDICTAVGYVSCLKDSIENSLKKEKGVLNVLIVGGALEAMDHGRKDNVLKLYLEKRKGFIKIAIRCGTDLIPSITFGENQLYDQLHLPFFKKIQLVFERIFGFVPMLFNGRGIFQYTFGYLPARKPLYVVIGKPIHVDKDPNPSREKIQEMHRTYINELKELYEKYNPLYGDPNMKLIIS